MAGRGPLPNPNARRRNAPTIPTTTLPAGGRAAPAPDVPDAYPLGEAGRAFWDWAWTTPQAASWDDGATYTVARRASLEDDLATLEHPDFAVDLVDLLSIDEEAARTVAFAIGRLKAMAGGRVGVMREIRELDKTLGMNPKALADLRWSIVPDSKPAVAAVPDDEAASNVRRFRPRDPAASTG